MKCVHGQPCVPVLVLCSLLSHVLRTCDTFVRTLIQVALATLLSSYSISLKPGHRVPLESTGLGFAPDAVHFILKKL
jgi:hypothetical protein